MRTMSSHHLFFERLVSDDRCLSWNYECMILFGKPYFLRMYRFFGIESNFSPDVYDGNAPQAMKEHFRNPMNRTSNENTTKLI